VLDLHRVLEGVGVGADRRVRRPQRTEPARERVVEIGVEPAGQLLGRFPAPDLLERQPPIRLEAGDVEAGAGEGLAVALGSMLRWTSQPPRFTPSV
jgi:hypothetical protein